MSTETVIKIENLSKQYRLGAISRGMLTKDLQSWWARVRGREDPNSRLLDDARIHAQGDRIWALKDVNLEVGRGEVLGIIGKNGAGKSTLLKILTRVTRSTTGTVKMKGRVASLLEVGTGFHPELTGRENIYLNGTILGMAKGDIDRKFDEIVAFSEVGSFVDTPVKRYSSGMYVRLAFAVAAHLEPEILLVDEVLAVGDASFQKKCLGKMEEVARGGRTVLFVSHNMASILSLCDRVILLDTGQIASFGDAKSVVEQYLETEKHDTGAEVVWQDPNQAPGDHIVRLHAVRMLVENGLATTYPDISKEILIQIEYWNLCDSAKLCPTIGIKNPLGEFVLAAFDLPSASSTVDPLSGKNLPAGLFRTTCRIPANLLNDIPYMLTAGIDSNVAGHGRAVADDIIRFQGFDSGAMRKEYSKSWPGSVRTRLGWYTEPLESEITKGSIIGVFEKTEM